MFQDNPTPFPHLLLCAMLHLDHVVPPPFSSLLPNMSDLGCAVRSDGTLKDASEIDWAFDKDDETTMPKSESSMPHPTHPFFTGPSHPTAVMAPAAYTAGSRRSNRSIRPSTRITDPNNAMNKSNPSTVAQASTSVGEKCKAPNSKPTHRVIQKVVTDSDSDDDENPSYSTQVSSEAENIDDVQSEFEVLQAMADKNHEVSTITQRTFYPVY